MKDFLSIAVAMLLLIVSSFSFAEGNYVSEKDIEQIKLLGNSHPPKELLLALIEGNEIFVKSMAEIITKINNHKKYPLDVKLRIINGSKEQLAFLQIDKNPNICPLEKSLSSDQDPWMRDVYKLAMAKIKGEENPKLLIIDSNRGGNTKKIPEELAKIWGDTALLNLKNPSKESDYSGNIEVTANNVLYTGTNLSSQMKNFFENKGYKNRMVLMNNDWLVIGHVDEQVSIINLPKDPCGMAIVKADPKLALSIIKKQGRIDSNQVSKEYQNSNTLDFVILLQQFLKSSNPTPIIVSQLKTSKIIDANVLLLKQKIIELSPACKNIKIISLPILFSCEDESLPGGCSSVLPNSVNMSILGQHLIVPDPLFIPFQKYIKKELKGLKQIVYFLDDNNSYHEQLGNIHCGTNELRTEKK